jgi:hypothetical protein
VGDEEKGERMMNSKKRVVEKRKEKTGERIQKEEKKKERRRRRMMRKMKRRIESRMGERGMEVVRGGSEMDRLVDPLECLGCRIDLQLLT